MAKTKSKRKIIIFSIVAAAGIGLAAFASLKKTDPPVSVETEKVVRRDLIEKVVANGKIEPVVQVKISPEVSGEIIELAVKEGQQVKKGDLLVKIKPDNYLAASNSAAASYNLAVANKSTAEANLEKARLEFERSSGLYQGQARFRLRLSDGQDHLRRGQNHPGRRGRNRWPWPRPPSKPPPPTFPKPPFIRPWTARSANSIPNWASGSSARP